VKYRSLFSLLLAVTACAFFTTPVQAQSDQTPDFSNVNDILHGNRTLLRMTDIQIFSAYVNSGFYSLNPTWGLASNSSLSLSSTFGAPISTLSGGVIKSFSGWMFNHPSPLVLANSFCTWSRRGHLRGAVGSPVGNRNSTHFLGDYRRSHG
jgi:hypothetical protein